MRQKIRVVGAIIEQDGKVLITQRPPKAVLPLLWEFPGGKVEPDETDEQALARELREDLEIEVVVGERATESTHSYPQYDIDFAVYRCRIVGGEIVHRAVRDHRWVRTAELSQYEFPPADEATISMLLGLG